MNHALRTAMTDAGLTAETLAEQVGVDPKTAARWVNPGRVPQPRHRARVAAILQRDIEALWPDVLRRVPVWFRAWQDIERDAVALRWYEPAWIPGLLQTEAYARATLAGEVLTADEIDQYVAARMQRQAILRRERPPLLIAVIDETVLRRLGHCDVAMARGQIAHLIECAEMPHVELHVVPMAAGLYPGLGGPITLADTPDGARVGHVDAQLAARMVDQACDVATLASRWERIRSCALSSIESISLIRDAVSWIR